MTLLDDWLSSGSVPSLRRYVAGEVFLAHANWLPLRCATVGKFDAFQSDRWIAREMIRKYIATFIRDDSFTNPVNQCVKNN